jgi:hypothetical protein
MLAAILGLWLSESVPSSTERSRGRGSAVNKHEMAGLLRDTRTKGVLARVPIITTNLPPHSASLKGFVETQRGAVAAGNRPGGGAMFTIRLTLAICIGASSVPNRQFVAQKVVATDSVDGSFVPPSSAALLAVSRLKMRGDRLSEFVAQIKITAKAL